MDDVAELGALHVTLVIGVEPVLEPGPYLVEWRRRERVMDHDIIPLQLLDQQFGETKPTRYRLERDEIRLKFRRLDLSVILDKVDATKPPKEPALLADLEFYFRLTPGCSSAVALRRTPGTNPNSGSEC